MTKEEKIINFDPNNLAMHAGHLYGLPFSLEDASLVIIPVPWEVTVSYSAGTAKGPKAILEASKQVDLYDPYIPDAWKLGLYMLPIESKVKSLSNKLRKKAEKYIDLYSKGHTPNEHKAMQKMQMDINDGCRALNDWVMSLALDLLDAGKMVAMLGGDHSTPLGLMNALSTKYKSFGILQIDAHADLRDAYEGFEYSHASIMYNAIKIPNVSNLIQVGIRDYCDAENEIMSANKKVKTFFDHEIKRQQYNGVTWKRICADIVKALPIHVYLSFDIDGLDPKLCPNTGTPVPGGFEFEQALYLIQEIIDAGKIIIGFDVNEVSPGHDEWDANVGARLLYRISNMVMKQHENLKMVKGRKTKNRK